MCLLFLVYFYGELVVKNEGTVEALRDWEMSKSEKKDLEMKIIWEKMLWAFLDS